MAITISGENNNDRILAQDGVIDSISGFNIAGIITASSFTGDLTGDVTGNVTGNINNSTLLLQTGSTERVRITSDGKISTGALASPDGNLHVYSSSAGSVTAGTDANELVLESSANVGMSFLTATNSISRIKFGDSRQSNRGVIAYNHGLDCIVFHTVGAERLRISSGGNVGIGTNDPQHKLHISGAGQNTLRVDSSGQAISIHNHSEFIGYIGNESGKFFLNAGGTEDTLLLKTNGSERLRIASDGKVGVGTNLSSSTYKFEVWDDTSATFMVRRGNTSRIVLSNDSQTNTLYSQTISGYAARPFAVRIGQSEALRIDSNGRVLIGHGSTPAAVASVAVVGSYGASSNLTPFVYVCRDEDATSIGGNESLGQILFASKDGYRGAVIEAKAAGAWSGSSSDGYLVFKTTPDNTTVPVSRLRITSDGKVGINQVPTRELSLHSPDNNNALIHFTNDDTGETASDGILIGLNGNEDCIVNNQESGKNIIVYTHNGSSVGERLRITSGGAVGINESSPAAQLHVENDNANASTYYLNTDAAILVQNKNSNATGKTVIKLEGPGGGGDCALVYGGGSTNMIFADRQNERLRITSNGSVRVGNNSSFTANTNADNLVVGNTNSGNNNGISIISHTNSEPRINFASSADDDAGMIKYAFSSNVLQLYASGSEKLQCNSDGVKISNNAIFNNWLHIGKNGGYSNISSVGHNNSATYVEGINWHYTTNYGIYRTKADWSNPYAQLRLDWPTGIAMAGGSSYGLSGVRFMCAALPSANNTYDLGTNALRWKDVYCNQGAFNNSDVELKQDIASLTAAEMKAAKRLSALFKTYRWKDAVEEKGTDKARTHTGMIAQQIQAAMSAEGLDATKYGLFGIDEWYENDKKEIITLDQLKDNIPDPLDSSKTISPMSTEGYTKVRRYSVRYTELLSFIAAYNDQRFADLESRVAALEGS